MSQPTDALLLPRERARTAIGFAIMAAVGVVGGGLVSAVTRPLSWEHGSWAAAYLVLVVGVAQLLFGAGQAWLAARMPGPRWVAVELLCWNVGSGLVIAGAVVERPVLVDVGGVLLVVALACFIAAVRERRHQRGGATSTVPSAAVWGRRAYQLLALVILVSIPVGLVLAALDGR